MVSAQSYCSALTEFMTPIMAYNSCGRGNDTDSTWPSSSQALRGRHCKAGPCFNETDYFKLLWSSASTRWRLWLFPHHSTCIWTCQWPFSLCDHWSNEEKNCLGERHVFHFLTLAARSSAGFSESPLSKSLPFTANVLKRKMEVTETRASKQPLKSVKTENYSCF